MEYIVKAYRFNGEEVIHIFKELEDAVYCANSIECDFFIIEERYKKIVQRGGRKYEKLLKELKEK